MNTTGQGGNNSANEVSQHVNKAGAAAQQFFDEAKASGQGLIGAVDLQGRVERNPYGMVAAAIGVGYLLGGGLFSGTTARLLRFGLKLAAIPLIRNELIVFAESAMDGVLGKARKTNAVQPTSPE